MRDGLEQRLRVALARGRSGGDVEERALRAALAALPAPARRGRARTLLLAAGVGVAAVAAACALAASGTLHVSLGAASAERPGAARVAVPRLTVPAGLRGIAAVVDGRLWLATAAGVRIEGLRVTSAELSPRALYVAAGIGRTLVAMAPDGRRAWARDAGGPVDAIAWAPSGLEIAYVTRRGQGFELRLVEGDGDHDRLVDATVRPVRPSWRGDSLALAYVGAGGRAAVYDLGHATHRAVAGPESATGVAYAPAGPRLAVAAANGVWTGGRGPMRRVRAARFRPALVAWTGRGLAVVAGPRGGRVLAVAPAGGSPLLALAGRDGVRVVGAGGRPLLVLPHATRVDDLVAR